MTAPLAPTRRAVLGSAAAAAAAATAGLGLPRAGAAVPPAGQQAPGFYRYTVGSVQVTVVNDGVSRMPVGDGFVLNASKADVQAALSAAYMDPAFYAGPYNPIVINTGAKLVLVDTGTGEAAFTASKGLNGRFLQNLAAAGIAPAQIDAVVLTHYHGDHINGLLRADGSVAFPNAEVLAPAREHAFWTDEAETSRATNPRVPDGARNVRRVLGGEVAKRLRTYDWDKEVLPGLTAVGTPGHTPGHTSLVLASGGKHVYIQGDVTHAPVLFARNPGWHFMLDVDPIAAEATRRRVYDMLVAERMLVQGFHYPFPALAHVARSGTGYREELVPWSTAL
ncbi:MBL fold metallo-hydrolase [Rhodoplanes sp. TEM]|uniref:MBL fold metallo-hydrolase n=1 Tax=Rhodoplanes tepidamans TaxID=200616 RepID=A0ABT5JKH2_RHOTP|nr:MULTISPECIES: MBL fold metallo-hydrolase [Rhodoplanes]MDC7789846.1 MBL fold metallo-hydrolase [Rhodoplanes tepidamans]MDC7987780.1 MBL fold metallo-hydrolase [Rhodoplanes sp. TEM]MDQ0358497.1 glyoxylase-like metal-dependent hydrolase (beta-lactamase superfamily II) [Rhodoplanes tepidamans]